MNNDMAIKYNAKLIEIKDTIDELKKFKMKTDSFEDMITEIETTVKKDVKDAYDKFNKNDNNSFLTSTLDNIYEVAVKKIEKINSYLVSTYSNYYKIQAVCNDLSSRIENNNVNNIDELVEEAKELLNELKSTSSIDYEEEKTIVEYVYSIVYKILGLETIYSVDSELFDYVVNDEIDSIYIAKLIKEDVNRLKDDKDIKRLVEDISRNGFESKYYIDKDLIRLIAYIGNKDYNDKIKDNIIEEIEDYCEIEEIIEENDKSLVCTEKDLKDLAYKLKKNNKNIGKLVIHIGVISAAVVGTISLLNISNMGIKYKTTTEVYDSITEQVTIEEGYTEGKSGRVKVSVYSPWEKAYLSDSYSRTVKDYEIIDADLTYVDFNDYLKVDAGNMNKISSNTEITDLLLDDAKYEGNKYIVTRITKDLSDFEKPNKIIIICIASFIGTIVGFVNINTFPIDLNISDEKKRLKQVKRKLLELNNKKDELFDSLIEMKTRIENKYDKLPYSIKEDENVKKKMLLLDDKKECDEE